MFMKKEKQAEQENNLRISKAKHDRKHILTAKTGFYLKEAYRSLRTNVSFALADTEGCRVIMVTSALQGEGKSITALNLSISLGQMDQKVLLIDCDLRRPKLARLMNTGSPVGLSNLLMDMQKLDSAIVHSQDHGIDMVFAGDIPPNPAELLSSKRMSNLLAVLREKYDYIILDTPPVDLVVDAVALSAQCDGVLFVVRAKKTERGAVICGMEQLQYAGANVIGFVFNGMTSETTKGYGKYRYRRYAAYGRYGKYARYGYKYGYGYGRGYGYGYGHQSVTKEKNQ